MSGGGEDEPTLSFADRFRNAWSRTFENVRAANDPAAQKRLAERDAAEAKAKDDRKARLTREAEAAATAQAAANAARIKLLILGCGLTGKSSVFKQFLVRYMHRTAAAGYEPPHAQSVYWSEGDLHSYVSVVTSNIYSEIKTLMRQTAKGPALAANKQHWTYIDTQIKGEEELTPERGAAIAAVWSDENIQYTYHHRQIDPNLQFQLVRPCMAGRCHMPGVTPPLHIISHPLMDCGGGVV